MSMEEGQAREGEKPEEKIIMDNKETKIKADNQKAINYLREVQMALDEGNSVDEVIDYIEELIIELENE